MMLAGTDIGRRIAVLIALCVGLAVLAWSGSALAHASLIAAEPADGAVILQKPAAFKLTFNEPVSPLVLKLVAPDGSITELAGSKVEGASLAIPAATEMTPGTYILSWRVVSLDGHPIGGTIAFSLGHPSASGYPSAAAPDRPLRAAIWLARFLVYAGLFFGSGAALYRALIAPPPDAARKFALTVSSLGLVATIASVGLQGLDALAAPLGGFFHIDVWRAAAFTTYAATASLATLALAASLAALRTKELGPARLLAFIAVTIAGLAFAASGHASNAPPQWLSRPAVFVHAVALIFWIGALPPLALALREAGEGATRALAHFSRLIPFSIAPLVLSGLALAWVQLGTPAALWETGYGRVLLAKLALLTALFALASWNRWSLTAKAEGGDPAATRSLIRSIAVEIVLVVAILGVVALWRFTPPPRAILEAAPTSVQAHLHGEKAMAHLSLSPGRAGRVTATIAIMSNEAEAIEPNEVTLAVAKPGSGLEPLARPAHRMSDGAWRVDDLIIPLAGKWSARVEILVGDFERIRLEGPVEIGP